MCNGISFFQRHSLQSIDFAAAAQVGKDGFDSVPKASGVYAVRVVSTGARTSIAKIKQRYLGSAFFRAIENADASSEAMRRAFGWGHEWGWREGAGARARLERLERIQLTDGELACALLYVGRANNLRRRMSELAFYGHTINHPFWALHHSGWTFEIGWQVTRAGAELAEEARLKTAFARDHGSAKPALVDR
jgi:hypothetical protein